MADETTETKTPEQKAANAKKKELRRLKNDMKVIREKTKELAAERKKVEESYNTLATEMGLPTQVKKGKKGE
jgi:flagellar motility protein MotE (MotC chaperone)